MSNLVRLERKNFPFRLLRLPKQPQCLYISGNPEILDKPSLAIIGSRQSSEWGLDQAFKISMMMSKENITVVSGLARGVDASAHRGALEGAGSTIAVLGSGFNRLYPPENLPLANQIQDSGLLISEYDPDEGSKELISTTTISACLDFRFLIPKSMI
jgi:DNA processing protein